MLTLETALAAVGSATLTVAGLRTIGLLLAARRTTPSWLRRRLGLTEVR
jgi:hypothetical protein